MEKKKKLKMSNLEKIQNDFQLDTFIKELFTTKSPHILITRTFSHIEENSIILHCSVLDNDNSHSRKISYKIKSVEKEIKLKEKILIFILEAQGTMWFSIGSIIEKCFIYLK